MAATHAQSDRTTQVGNPLLGQIHEFIQNQETEPADPFGIVVRAIRGRMGLISFLVCVAAILLALLAWIVVDPIYQSTAAVRILPREAKLLYADADDTRLRLYDAFVTAEVHLLQSRPILESAWQQMASADGLDFVMPKDVGALGGLLTVSNRKGLVTIAARSNDPGLSATTVNSVLDSFETYKDSERSRLTHIRRTELEGRANSLASSLEDLDNRYLQIAGEHDMISLSKAHIAKTAQLEVIEERVGEVENTIVEFRQTGSIGADDIRNAEIQRALLLDQALAEMTYERASRMAELSTLRTRYQPSHEKILTSELELATLEEAITERRDQITTLGNVGALTGGASQSSEKSLEDLISVRDKLLARRELVGEEARTLIGKLVKLRRIFAEQTRVGELLDETKKALDEVIVESQAGLSRSINVIARGKVPDGPIEDKRKPIAFGAALFGTLGTLMLIVLVSIFNPRLRFSDELSSGIYKKVLLALSDCAPGSDELREAGFTLRNELEMRCIVGPGPLVIGVASTSEGGESDQAAFALANAFAARDVNALLIDSDPQRAITNRLELGEGPGLIDMVSESGAASNAVHRVDTYHGEISVIGAGMRKADPLRSPLATITMRDYQFLIDKAAADHEVVILDLGVLSAGKHSALGASVSNQFVLLTSAGDRKREVTAATAILDRVIPEQYFLVMNQANQLDPMLDTGDGHGPRTGGPFNPFSYFTR